MRWFVAGQDDWHALRIAADAALAGNAGTSRRKSFGFSPVIPMAHAVLLTVGSAIICTENWKPRRNLPSSGQSEIASRNGCRCLLKQKSNIFDKRPRRAFRRLRRALEFLPAV